MSFRNQKNTFIYKFSSIFSITYTLSFLLIITKLSIYQSFFGGLLLSYGCLTLWKESRYNSNSVLLSKRNIPNQVHIEAKSKTIDLHSMATPSSSHTSNTPFINIDFTKSYPEDISQQLRMLTKFIELELNKINDNISYKDHHDMTSITIPLQELPPQALNKINHPDIEETYLDCILKELSKTKHITPYLHTNSISFYI